MAENIDTMRGEIADLLGSLNDRDNEIARLRAALTQIASVANHGVNNPAEALARVSSLCDIHQQCGVKT